MENSSCKTFRSFIELGKLNITIPVSLSGFTGYFLYTPVVSLRILLVTAAIFAMAVSASAVNQLQEVETDRKMGRTKKRPLPSGKLSSGQAILFAVFAFLAGFSLFAAAESVPALVISLVTISWYNLVYTPLKRHTPYAIIPGSVTGALPPLIGWVAAGGDLFDISIILVQLLFFIGQIPHFWLLVLRYGEEYTAAGLPSLTTVLSRKSISFLVTVFVYVSAIISIALGLSGIIHSTSMTVTMIAFSSLLILVFSRYKSGNDSAKYSMLLNVYFLLVMFVLISDRIIS